jgi:hypothetical protein
VLRLTAPDKSDKGRVVLSVAKAKGYRIKDVVMRLDFDSRWFYVTNETPPVVLTSYQKTVQSVMREMTTAEIIEAGENLGNAKRTTEQNLKDAIRNGHLLPVRRDVYASPETAATAYTRDAAEVAGTDDATHYGEVLDESGKLIF